MGKIIEIAQFDFMDTQEVVFAPLFGEEVEGESNYSKDQFDTTGYGSFNCVINLGTLIFIILYFVVFAILLRACRPVFRRNKKTMEWRQKKSKGLFWNTFIRLGLEGCLGFAVAVIYNFDILSHSGSDQDANSLKMGPFFWINMVTLVILAIVLIGGPIFLAFFYLRRV